MNASTQRARMVITELITQGVTDVVLAPGSRDAPLLFAAYDAADAGLLRLHTRIDERSAGFLAVGLLRGGVRGAAVVCTSGTAVANLHPAVLEAAHAGLVLWVVTADRPERLRFTGANQTTEQVGIFGPLVKTRDIGGENGGDLSSSAVQEQAQRVSRDPGPVHLNVRFDDPLLPDDRWAPQVEVPPWAPRRRTVTSPALDPGPRTVVVAGDDAGPSARVLAEQAGWPLFAEPSSGSRTGANGLRCYRLLLDGGLGHSLGQEIERVVVLGHPTLSRPITRLLTRSGVEVLDVEPRGVWRERPFESTRLDGVPKVDQQSSPDWLAAWHEADAAVGRRLDALLAAEAEVTPYDVAGAVARALPPGGLLYVGASSPIRDLDLMVPRYDVGARRKVVANRGLSGIDGVVSSAIGAALGRPQSTRALALMGDVTFLHDSNGLILGPDEPGPDLTIVVANDDGGSIFSMLEQGAPEHADRFDRLFGTPHGVDLASLCAATRTPHWRVESLAELEHALAAPNGGIEVIEVACRRDNRRDLDARIRALRR